MYEIPKLVTDKMKKKDLCCMYMYERIQNMNEREEIVAHGKLLELVLTSSSSFSPHTTSQNQLLLTKDGLVEINSI